MSPWAPSGECLFRITECGVSSVEAAAEEAMSQPRRWTQERGESIRKEPKNCNTFSSEAGSMPEAGASFAMRMEALLSNIEPS